MDRLVTEGDWLLIDAAGPCAVAGLLSGGNWIQYETSEGDLLEWLHPAIQRLTTQAERPLLSLAGAIYATGPGSTLGLRLAAMCLRTFLSHPAFRHWRCLQYNNLEVAMAGSSNLEPGSALVAPWRRDRWHRTTLTAVDPLRFRNDAVDPEQAIINRLHGVDLGRRPPVNQPAAGWEAYPWQQLPGILFSNTELLQEADQPTPYMAEEPTFVRWSPRRHTGK